MYFLPAPYITPIPIIFKVSLVCLSVNVCFSLFFLLHTNCICLCQLPSGHLASFYFSYSKEVDRKQKYCMYEMPSHFIFAHAIFSCSNQSFSHSLFAPAVTWGQLEPVWDYLSYCLLLLTATILFDQPSCNPVLSLFPAILQCTCTIPQFCHGLEYTVLNQCGLVQ